MVRASGIVAGKFFFLHVPRTGGTSVSEFLQSGGLLANSKLDHPSLQTVREVTDLPVLVFVRRPLDILTSWWGYIKVRLRVPKKTWNYHRDPQTLNSVLPLMDTDIHGYARRYLEEMPGFLSDFLDFRLKSDRGPPEHVGRFEDLASDLGEVLSHYGINTQLSKLERLNTGGATDDLEHLRPAFDAVERYR